MGAVKSVPARLQSSTLNSLLQPCDAKLPTKEFNDLNHDIFYLILHYIHPGHVLKYRRVCRIFNEYLQTPYFAILNLSRFIENDHQTLYHRTAQTYYPNEYDRLWFKWPQVYQQSYARLTSYRKEIDWAYARGLGSESHIPAPLGNLDQLIKLELTFMDLYGPIPIELGNLNRLSHLSLSCNKLTGSIPKEFGALGSLTHLTLYKNCLSGELPKELGKLVTLRTLNLADNEFTGQIPAELGALDSLKDFRLSNNKLTGFIPPEIGQLISLEYFYAANNQLEGCIPAELGSLYRLSTLDLKNNMLTGIIPPELGSMTSLESLNLANNRLSGPIPKALGSLLNIKRIDLASNNLAGLIPIELANAPNLRWLYIQNNELDGTIPAELGTNLRLSSFKVSGNFLSRPVPKSLKRVISLYDRLTMGSKRGHLRRHFSDSFDLPSYLSYMRLIRVSWSYQEKKQQRTTTYMTIAFIGPCRVAEALLTCDVCAELLRGSAVLPCRHSFCSECIRRHFQSSSDCPSCRVAVKNGMVDVRFCMVLDALAENLRCSKEALYASLETKEKPNSNSGQSRTNEPPPTTQATKNGTKGKKKLEQNDSIESTCRSKRKDVEVQTSPVRDPSLQSLSSKSSSKPTQLPPAKRARLNHVSGSSSSSSSASLSMGTSITSITISTQQVQPESRTPILEGPSEIFGDADAYFECPICNHSVQNRHMDSHISSNCLNHVEKNPPAPPPPPPPTTPPTVYVQSSPEVIKFKSWKSGHSILEYDEISDNGSGDPEDQVMILESPPPPPVSKTGLHSSLSNTSSIQDLETTDDDDDESSAEDLVKPSDIRRKESPIRQSPSSLGLLDATRKNIARSAILANIMPSKSTETRRPKPGVAYDTLKDAQIRKILKDDGLRTTGDKATLKKRHKEFTLLHNANLDTLNPLPQSAIMAKMALWEQTHGELSGGKGNMAAGMGAVAAFTGHSITPQGQERDRKHMEQYADEFRALIERLIIIMSTSLASSILPIAALKEEEEVLRINRPTNSSNSHNVPAVSQKPAAASSWGAVANDVAVNWIILPFVNGLFFRFINLAFKLRTANKQKLKQQQVKK
ncbi:hypothetical protein BDR26DRAFT_1003637 [Obelidium mucronatum]|nr:hypothetical protein BDR26DRAFT_1003637 [Obelidium mucronatum]